MTNPCLLIPSFRLHHPNIVELLEVHEEKSKVFLVMELWVTTIKNATKSSFFCCVPWWWLMMLCGVFLIRFLFSFICTHDRLGTELICLLCRVAFNVLLFLLCFLWHKFILLPLAAFFWRDVLSTCLNLNHFWLFSLLWWEKKKARHCVAISLPKMRPSFFSSAAAQLDFPLYMHEATYRSRYTGARPSVSA